MVFVIVSPFSYSPSPALLPFFLFFLLFSGYSLLLLFLFLPSPLCYLQFYLPSHPSFFLPIVILNSSFFPFFSSLLFFSSSSLPQVPGEGRVQEGRPGQPAEAVPEGERHPQRAQGRLQGPQDHDRARPQRQRRRQAAPAHVHW